MFMTVRRKDIGIQPMSLRSSGSPTQPLCIQQAWRENLCTFHWECVASPFRPSLKRTGLWRKSQQGMVALAVGPAGMELLSLLKGTVKRFIYLTKFIYYLPAVKPLSGFQELLSSLQHNNSNCGLKDLGLKTCATFYPVLPQSRPGLCTWSQGIVPGHKRAKQF